MMDMWLIFTRMAYIPSDLPRPPFTVGFSRLCELDLSLSVPPPPHPQRTVPFPQSWCSRWIPSHWTFITCHTKTCLYSILRRWKMSILSPFFFFRDNKSRLPCHQKRRWSRLRREKVLFSVVSCSQTENMTRQWANGGCFVNPSESSSLLCKWAKFGPSDSHWDRLLV